MRKFERIKVVKAKHVNSKSPSQNTNATKIYICMYSITLQTNKKQDLQLKGITKYII